MFPVDIENFFAVLLACATAMFIGFELYALRRDRGIHRNLQIETLYCCTRCGKIYIRRRSKKAWKEDKPVPCPHCGFKNTRMKF